MQTSRVRLAPDLVQRIKGEFLEMPGLRLTEPQARRLWALDQTQCSTVLTELVSAGFLRRTPEGAFLRGDPAKPARATIRPPSSGASSAA